MSRHDAILGGGSRQPRPPGPGDVSGGRSRRYGRRAPGAILGRGERGAAAVEAALFLSVVLLPLLMGVITYGSYFWQAQKAEPLSARLPLQNIVGTFNCAELVDRVKTTVRNALPNVNSLFDGQIPLEAISVQVIQALPTVGVDIELSITLPAANQLGGLIPLPNGGDIVTEATYRLDNVKLTTAGC